jgi:L-2-hydroxyglutarate oxidase
MADTIQADIVIIGAGIVGLATARELSQRTRGAIVVLEAEAKVASHQTGHNSGVIHAGLYYKPGSLKARLCGRGREMMYDFCRRHEVPHDNCGKVVVATHEDELGRLATLHDRAVANGLTGVRRFGRDELRAFEPHAAGIAGLHVPQTGIVDFGAAARAMRADAERAGVQVLTSSPVVAIDAGHFASRIHTPTTRVYTRRLINCAGLQSDRVARLAGLEPRIRIFPFRGEYWLLRPRARHLVRSLIYPVPNPQLPFLGVHLTRTVHGEVDAGPNAVLALGRHAYRRRDVSLAEAGAMLTDPALWMLLAEHARSAAGEAVRSLSKRAFANGVRRLVPELTVEDLMPGPSGVRAQAVSEHGRLIDDFAIIQTSQAIHVLNAPSPAATASLAIGEHIADIAERRLGIHRDRAA